MIRNSATILQVEWSHTHQNNAGERVPTRNHVSRSSFRKWKQEIGWKMVAKHLPFRDICEVQSTGYKVYVRLTKAFVHYRKFICCISVHQVIVRCKKLLNVIDQTCMYFRKPANFSPILLYTISIYRQQSFFKNWNKVFFLNLPRFEITSFFFF